MLRQVGTSVNAVGVCQNRASGGQHWPVLGRRRRAAQQHSAEVTALSLLLVAQCVSLPFTHLVWPCAPSVIYYYQHSTDTSKRSLLPAVASSSLARLIHAALNYNYSSTSLSYYCPGTTSFTD